MTQVFYGTKRIEAEPMTRQAYNDFRGWQLPSDENGDDAGYLVVYPDSKSNTEKYDGYVSWSPKDVFEAAYQSTDGLSFGHALVALKAGHKVARAGWNGKGMWLEFRPGIKVEDYSFTEQLAYLLLFYPKGSNAYQAGAFVPWLASQTDTLADDWMIVE